MNIKKILGTSVRKRRADQNLTQEQLSSAAGISSRFLQSIEAGQYYVSFLTVFKIARALNTTPDKLLLSAWKEWKKEIED